MMCDRCVEVSTVMWDERQRLTFSLQFLAYLIGWYIPAFASGVTRYVCLVIGLSIVNLMFNTLALRLRFSQNVDFHG